MKQIPLSGRHANGPYTHAIVDDDLFEELSAFRWKAVRNAGGNHTYAVRSVKESDGRSRDIRMHRLVLGYRGPLDVRHRNHIGTDNRRENLELATRRETSAGRRTTHAVCTCPRCGGRFTRLQALGTRKSVYCGDVCRIATNNELVARIRAQRLAARQTIACSHCRAPLLKARSDHEFCSARCRKAAKRLRQKAEGLLPPSAKHPLNTPTRNL
jgi:hypothetical protein